MKYISLLLILLVQFAACKEKSSDNFVDLDLMSNGIPLKIKAPVGAEVNVNDMGIIKDISVTAKPGFALQIMMSSVTDYDVDKLIASELAVVKNAKYFSKIVSEDKSGFIYEKDIDGKLNYDFRIIKIQGENEFDFQRSLGIGTYTLDDVKMMYEAVK